MINMLIAMMAKTFDNIHEEQAVNFNNLRAKIIMGWIEQHPSPPPFNLLAFFIGKPVSLLVRFCKRGGVAWAKAKRGGSSKSPSVPPSTPEKAAAVLGADENHRPPKDKHFDLVADHLDVNHTRKLAMLLSSFIGDAVAIEPAPGVTELREKLDAHVCRGERGSNLGPEQISPTAVQSRSAPICFCCCAPTRLLLRTPHAAVQVAAQDKATQQLLEQQTKLLAIVQQRLPTNLGGDLGYLAQHAASFGFWDKNNAGGAGAGDVPQAAAVDRERSVEIWRRDDPDVPAAFSPQAQQALQAYEANQALSNQDMRAHQQRGSVFGGFASEVRDGVNGIADAVSASLSKPIFSSAGKAQQQRQQRLFERSSSSSVGQRVDRFFAPAPAAPTRHAFKRGFSGDSWIN